MKRIKIGIALITLSGLLLGTASVAIAKTTSPVHLSKVSRTSTKSLNHSAKKHAKSTHTTTKSHAKNVTKHA